MVILTWDDGDLLDAAVRSALASTAARVNVIVVDNGSEPPAAIAPDLPIRLLRNKENRGVSAGRNQGAAAGSAPAICFLDSDARLHALALSELLGALASDSSIALAAPVFSGQPPTASAGRAPSLLDKILRVTNRRSTYRPMTPARATPGPLRDVEFAIGACQVVRRDAFEAVGGFDERYFYGPEDVDLCLRLLAGGQRVVQVSGAWCEHPPRRRNRRLLTRRGLGHAWAVLQHLWRHHRLAT